jgi:hypothetical protein
MTYRMTLEISPIPTLLLAINFQPKQFPIMADIELSTQYAVYLSLSSRVAWEPPGGGEQALGKGHFDNAVPVMAGEHRRPELVEPGEARVRPDEPGGTQR